MERVFEEGEVLEVVKAMKAPGLDGFSMAFFQAFCDVLKEDIMKAFHDFHARGKFEKNLIATFIALIPKISRATSLRIFA